MRKGSRSCGSTFRLGCERREPTRPGQPHLGNKKASRPADPPRGSWSLRRPHANTRTMTTNSSGKPITITRFFWKSDRMRETLSREYGKHRTCTNARPHIGCRGRGYVSSCTTDLQEQRQVESTSPRCR